MTEQVVIEQVRKWIRQFIIEYEICPFAAFPFYNDLIHYEVSFKTDKEGQLYDLVRLFVKIMSVDPGSISNAFMIYPHEKSTFEEFLVMDEMSGLLLSEYGYEEDLQVVLFHPHFRYADEDTDDPSNYTNRSPFPMIHVLRIAEVELTINNHKNIDSIPLRNKKLLSSMNEQDLLKIKNLMKVADS